MAKLDVPESPPPTEDLIQDAMTALAQGVINVHEGIIEVQAGSRVHRAMATVLSAWVFGHLKFIKNPKCKDE